MSRCYKYAIAQFVAHPARNECLNIAVVVINDTSLDIRMPKSLDKIKAISAALDADVVRESVEMLHDLDAYLQEQEWCEAEARLLRLTEVTPVKFSSVAEFLASSPQFYNERVEKLVSTLVEPEPAPPREIRRRPSKLLADVKLAFKAERVLARKGEGLDTHRVVANHKVAEGLSADFLLKNGAMHVVQTVDASPEDTPVRRTVADIAISALIFEQLRMVYGDSNTQSRLIYRARSASEMLITPALLAAERQGASLINWESRNDRIRFIVELSSLAEPLEAPTKRKSATNVHASIQPKLRLN